MPRRHSSHSDLFATSMHSMSISELRPSHLPLSSILDFDFDPNPGLDFDSDSASQLRLLSRTFGNRKGNFTTPLHHSTSLPSTSYFSTPISIFADLHKPYDF